MGERELSGKAMKLHPAHVVLTDTEALGGAKLTDEQRAWVLETMGEIETETL